MKMLIKIVIGLVAIIALLLIAALFVKKEYAVESEVTINKPTSEVFDYVKFLRNQENYSKWVRMDPNMKKEFRGTDGSVGFVYAWDGNDKAGKGEQEIKSLTKNKLVDIELRFEKPFKGTAYAFISTDSLAENQTKVKWGMKGANPYPFNLMHLFMLGMLEKDIQTSLNDLKVILEKN